MEIHGYGWDECNLIYIQTRWCPQLVSCFINRLNCFEISTTKPSVVLVRNTNTADCGASPCITNAISELFFNWNESKWPPLVADYQYWGQSPTATYIANDGGYSNLGLTLLKNTWFVHTNPMLFLPILATHPFFWFSFEWMKWAMVIKEKNKTLPPAPNIKDSKQGPDLKNNRCRM